MDNIIQAKTFFKTEQIESFVGHTSGYPFDKHGNMIGERRKLIVLHQNGDDKKELIAQLKLMISGLETNFDGFAAQ